MAYVRQGRQASASTASAPARRIPAWIGHVAGEQYVRVAQGAHPDVAGRPGADAGQAEQRLLGLVAVGAGVEAHGAVGERTGDRTQGVAARVGHAELVE